MTTRSDEAIRALANYMTSGPRVAAASMGLQIGGARKDEADAFFALRNAFGVSGYATAEEAEASIKAALA